MLTISRLPRRCLNHKRHNGGVERRRAKETGFRIQHYLLHATMRTHTAHKLARSPPNALQGRHTPKRVAAAVRRGKPRARPHSSRALARARQGGKNSGQGEGDGDGERRLRHCHAVVPVLRDLRVHRAPCLNGQQHLVGDPAHEDEEDHADDVEETEGEEGVDLDDRGGNDCRRRGGAVG